MKRTRISLFYLSNYLIIGGAGFLFVPNIVLQLFQSNGDYHNMILRMVGVLLISLGILVVQIIRLRISELYPTTLIVRIFILLSFISLYSIYEDPMMIVLTIIVGIGFFYTLSSYILDRRDRKELK